MDIHVTYETAIKTNIQEDWLNDWASNQMGGHEQVKSELKDPINIPQWEDSEHGMYNSTTTWAESQKNT